jgi:hypothetical protein
MLLCYISSSMRLQGAERFNTLSRMIEEKVVSSLVSSVGLSLEVSCCSLCTSGLPTR